MQSTGQTSIQASQPVQLSARITASSLGSFFRGLPAALAMRVFAPETLSRWTGFILLVGNSTIFTIEYFCRKIQLWNRISSCREGIFAALGILGNGRLGRVDPQPEQHRDQVNQAKNHEVDLVTGQEAGCFL